jgi:catechol 2,3-dioxygenase-like lactoylglutathione lyase family enzyme
MRARLSALASVLALAASVATGPAFAQPAPPNEFGVTMGHWHLNSRDVETNKKIFVALGGIAAKPGDFEIVKFPGVVVFLHQRPGTPAPVGGTVGTVVNHLGFYVPDVQAAVAKWKAAGVDVQPGGNGRTDQAWIITSEGLKVEILEDKTQTIPIRHHHVHFYVAESVIPDIQAWYVKHFGATTGTRGKFKTANIPGAELTFTPSDTPTVPTKGHVLDHIGFDVKDLVGLTKQLEAEGVKLDQPIVTQPSGAKLTFIHDPWGTSIELNERPNPL